MVLRLIKSFFCPTRASPNESFVQTPLEASHLRPIFSSVISVGVGWGVRREVKNVYK